MKQQQQQEQVYIRQLAASRIMQPTQSTVEAVDPEQQQQQHQQLPPQPLSPLITQATVGFSTSLDLLSDDDDDDNDGDDDVTRDDDTDDLPPPPGSYDSFICLQALHDLLTDLEFLPILAVATEASSHPTGLISILAQPWLYAGGGLGNENECTSIAYYNKPSSSSSSQTQIPSASTSASSTTTKPVGATATTTTSTAATPNAKKEKEAQTDDDTATMVVPHVMQTCLAGAASRRDATLPFAGLCWPAACDAVDLQQARHVLLPTLKKMVASNMSPPSNNNDIDSNTTTTTNNNNSASASSVMPEEEQIIRLHNSTNKSTTATTTTTTTKSRPTKSEKKTTTTTHSSWWDPTPAQVKHQQEQLALEYVTALQHMVDINHFLGTQWTCGNFTVPWNWLLAGPFVGIVTILVALSCTTGTTWFRRRPKMPTHLVSLLAKAKDRGMDEEEERNRLLYSADTYDDDEEKKHDVYSFFNGLSPSLSPSSSSAQYTPTQTTSEQQPQRQQQQQQHPFWSAFDVSKHLERLTTPHSSDTACLDGLRVFSLVWIVLGHVMAIVSSTGAGYSNPAHFMPPEGLTTKWLGQLLFSSRMSVDTFLIISGFLVVHVLKRKLVLPATTSTTTGRPDNLVFRQYLKHLPALLLTRVVRILPLYVLTLGFYTLIAPHMGSGPFWYQWLGLLKPCQEFWWTNILFINNFWPPDRAVVDTCFYHSWYLATDMQLFLTAPLLVMIYQVNSVRGRNVVACLFALSVATTVYFSWARQWSMNTFDGAAVARYDMEAYAKPHIRAQSYLAGMFVAMVLPKNEAAWKRRAPWTWKHQTALLAALSMLLFVAFVTGTGAYAQRPCQYQELPGKGLCGSAWPAWGTFLYTAFGRTIWTVGVSLIIHLCIGQRLSLSTDDSYETKKASGPSRIYANNFVSFVLSWKCWTPLSQLSFGVYLIHPIVIFVWQLGGRDKDVFRLLTFGLDLVSVCVVSYIAALVASLVVEFPCAALWKNFVVDRRRQLSQQRPTDLAETSTISLSTYNDSSPGTTTLTEQYGPSSFASYGSISPVEVSSR